MISPREMLCQFHLPLPMISFFRTVFMVMILSGMNLNSAEGKKPNIILIMADDMGYEALSANGSESCVTPNIDKMASEGIRFENAFSNPLCTPSRVKLMTGKYNFRNYTKFGVLDRSQKTFAHQLKSVGYSTCIAGKWQLGKEPDSPQHFGFDEAFLWQHTQSGRKKNGKTKIDKRYVNPILEYNGRPKDYEHGEYGPQLCSDFVCDFIEKNKKKPFFVYYPMILPHCPFDPTPESRDWDPKRPGSTTYKGDKMDPQRHFSDMVSYVDKIVGQIIEQLKKSGVHDDTLIIFTGDNGTDKPIVTKWNGREISGNKGALAEAGIRVPMVIYWKDGIKKPGRVADDLVEFTDVFPTLCELGGAPLPEDDPGDGVSLNHILKNQSEKRKKDLILIWYRKKVMIRNKQYSFIADQKKRDKGELWKHAGAFQSELVQGSSLSEYEKSVQIKFIEHLKRY